MPIYLTVQFSQGSRNGIFSYIMAMFVNIPFNEVE